jgi:HlyD family secretion protein
MTKSKAFWISVVTFLVGVGLYGYYVLNTINVNRDVATQNSSFETSVARTGDLRIIASGTGEIIPASEIGLTFGETGVVMEVLVSVGDRVQAGNVLVRLQTDQTEADLAAEIAKAELAYVQAQHNLDALYETAEIESANALIELENAQIALEDVMDLELEVAQAMVAIAQAEGTVEDAEMRLYIYNSSPSDDDVYTAYASLHFKQVELEELQGELEKLERKIKGVKDEILRERYEDQILQLKVALANQQIVVDEATYKLNSIDEAADPLDISVVEAQLDTAYAQLADAKRELSKLQNGPDPGSIAMAEARLNQTQAEWDRLKDGPDPDEIARLETALEKAKLALEVARQSTTVVELVAPIDGTVTTLNVDVGDRHDSGTGASEAVVGTSGHQTELDLFEELIFGTSNAIAQADDFLITIADLSQPLLEAYIDETDYQKAAIGYQVEVTFDALLGETFTGEIVEIRPLLESISNVQALPILVRLDAASYAKPIPLPIGLNASVDVIAGQAENTVLVPVEALVEINPDVYVVYVVENKSPQPRDVSIGLMDFSSVEIIAGITPGEVVAIGYENTTGN